MNLSSLQRHHYIASGTARVFLADVLVLPTGLVITVFLTRRLGPELYGLLALVMILVSWVESIITSIFGRATIKFVGGAEDWRPVGATVVRLYLMSGVGAMFLLWILATPIATLLNEPGLVACLYLLAFDIPLFSLACAHRNILVGTGGFQQRALVSAGRWIVRLVLIVLLVELGLSVSGAILGSVGASLAELVIARFYVRPSLFRRSNFPIRQVWGFAVPLFLSTLSLLFYSKLDLFALKVLRGTTAQVGIYGAARNLVRLPSIFAFSFSPILLSTLSRMLRDGESHPAREMGRHAMRLVIMLLPLAGLAAGAALEIVGLIFGPLFLPAAPLLARLIFGAMALVMISVSAAILTAADKPGLTFAVTGPMLPLAIAGHWILIPRLGSVGASLVTTVVAGLGAIVAVLLVYRVWRILPPAGTLLRSILVCVLAYALATFWSTPGVVLLLKLPAIVLVIVLAFLVLGEFGAGEIVLVRSMLRGPAVSEEDVSGV